MLYNIVPDLMSNQICYCHIFRSIFNFVLVFFQVEPDFLPRQPGQRFVGSPHRRALVSHKNWKSGILEKGS